MLLYHKHKSVLLEESIKYLINKKNGIYVDATFGGGGHSKKILKNINKDGKLFSFDQDIESIKNNNITDKRLKLFHQNFRFIKNVLNLYNIFSISGILVDLGVSYHQFDSYYRGFSIRYNNELDMRMNTLSDFTAKDIIDNYSFNSLNKIFYKYGDLKNSKYISKNIIKERYNIKKTFDIIKLFNKNKKNNKKKFFSKKKIKFFSKIFQSIRIEVNDEINCLKDLLYNSMDMLEKNGRIVVISYHSVEDRIVKNFLKTGSFDGKYKKNFFGKIKINFKLPKKKIIYPSNEEIKNNPRSRSAKLRWGEKI
ncbi:16S rRNA (cytosine(1402)-N(4))-methyltransferase RsmH [Candidatus Shikimatogenerans silvanidophilus]|uniref:16S rRNA (cytosine(1402)-N(4))-methyltransferase RsmH n=1 Tax=Candidatus Shikimatogenerans silvanidophilus TaxID=2782547 RepID=UPI001BA47CC0|nr:16S rRNA (cytosine(1402)-N(4))-methyltransferase RsmH [Candidatus Shikimatogenerans silvanidophilus]